MERCPEGGKMGQDCADDGRRRRRNGNYANGQRLQDDGLALAGVFCRSWRRRRDQRTKQAARQEADCREDRKSQIQALDRTQPGLPLKKGRAGTMTHDYKRHGTTTLFAALNVATGEVLSLIHI